MNLSYTQQLNTWDGAFMLLSPSVRQQSLRIADYTKALFEEACALPFGCGRKASAQAREEIQRRNASVAYKCGLYHQLGKALFPEKDQTERADFTDSELRNYRTYPRQGRLLVAYLQDGAKTHGGTFDGFIETPTKNVPRRMIREACEQHAERYNGSGYPSGLAGKNIAPIAQIVALAKELDRLATSLHSEEPFEEAFSQLLSRTGTDFSPELADVLRAAKAKCRRIFKKYIYYSNAVPKTVPLVDKQAKRPMGLNLCPMYGADGKIAAIDANPWFEKGETDYTTMETLLQRVDMTDSVQLYFLYEACDTLLRMKNHGVHAPIIVRTFAPFFRAAATDQLTRLFEDQPVDRYGLLLAVDEKLFLKESKSTADAVKAFADEGIEILVDRWHPENVPFERLQRLNVTHIRPADDLLDGEGTIGLLTALMSNGFTVYASTDREELKTVLAAHGAILAPPDNPSVSEIDLVRLLEEEQSHG